MKVSFSLKGKGTKPVGEAPSLKRTAAFAALDDDEPIDAAPTAKTGEKGKAAANKQFIAQSMEMSKAMKKKMEEEQRVDATVFEYDEVYDKMQEAKLRQKEAKESDSKERKPKYISGLLQSAATRRLDHLRAEEKMIQRERELEGDEFKDKGAFVTQAYKDQMAELREAEEEERQREEAERKKNKGNIGTGMAHFYRKLLEESEQQHEQTVAATEKPTIGPQGPNLTITKPTDFTPKSDAELAHAAREQGKEVELNDDNQIVDKRELLSAGLNLSAPNTRKLGLQLSSKAKAKEGENVEAHRAVGTAASRREINERRTREIQQQMEDEKRRLRDERDKEEREALSRTVARRNDEASVMSAKERYLERKRRRLEEAAAGGCGEEN